MTATRAAASIGPMVKEFITGTNRARAEGKQKLAYTFIVCHHEEILRAMDVLPVWTENFAGICGAKRDAERFLQRAESLGFSRSLCTYALCGIGFDQWREELGGVPPDAPWGGQARPDFMISSGQILCDPRTKWYHVSQQMHSLRQQSEIHGSGIKPAFPVNLRTIPYSHLTTKTKR